MRPLDCVIDRMIEVIPESDVIFREFLEDLVRIKRNYRHSDPSLMFHWWSEARESLEYYMGVIDREWKMEVKEIFEGKSR